MLDGFSNIKKLIKRVKELEMPAVAITDHGTMFGVIDFYKAARDAGVKPIIGVEAYMAARGMADRDPKLDRSPTISCCLPKTKQATRTCSRSRLPLNWRAFITIPASTVTSWRRTPKGSSARPAVCLQRFRGIAER